MSGTAAAAKRVTWIWVVASLAAILGVGLGAGWLLQQYDEDIGFHQEAARIAEVLELQPGMSVADVRAGTGKWTVDMARRVGETGQIYATAGPDPAHKIYEAVAEAGLDNVTVITRTPGDTARLPLECCHAILVRAVYHHFTVRPAFAGTLFHSLQPGGLLAIIDFGEGTPEQLSGHGISRDRVVRELTAAGFQVKAVIDDWEGNAYCAVFRRPATPSPS